MGPRIGIVVVGALALLLVPTADAATLHVDYHLMGRGVVIGFANITFTPEESRILRGASDVDGDGVVSDSEVDALEADLLSSSGVAPSINTTLDRQVPWSANATRSSVEGVEGPASAMAPTTVRVEVELLFTGILDVGGHVFRNEPDSAEPFNWTIRVPEGHAITDVWGDEGSPTGTSRVSADKREAEGYSTGNGFYGVDFEPDPDGDLLVDSADNCPAIANEAQADADGDGHGDACPAPRLPASETGESTAAAWTGFLGFLWLLDLIGLAIYGIVLLALWIRRRMTSPTSEVAAAPPSLWRRSKLLRYGTTLGVNLLLFAAMLAFAVEIPTQDLSPRDGAELRGRALLGPLQEATVRAYELRADGSKGKELASDITTHEGWYYLRFREDTLPPLLLEATGGTYQDEARGERVDAGPGVAVSAVIPGGGAPWVSLTPFTTMAAARAQAVAADGVQVDVAANSSNAGIMAQYALPDIIDTDPAWNLDNPGLPLSFGQRAYASLIGGVSQLALDLDVDQPVLVRALADDASDGLMDGTKDGREIEMEGAARAEGVVVFQVQDGAGTRAVILPTSVLNDLTEATKRFWGGQASTANIPPIPLEPIYFGANTVGGGFYPVPPQLPAWRINTPGVVRLEARGGTPPYACAAGSSLPTGFAVLPNCDLVGTPPGPLPAGTPFVVTQPFQIDITDATPIADGGPLVTQLYLYVTIMQDRPEIQTYDAVCIQNQPCPDPVIATATGGTGTKYFRMDTLRNGFPPFGAWIGSDGILYGTIKQLGRWTFSVCAVDQVGDNACGPVTVTVEESSTPTYPTSTTDYTPTTRLTHGTSQQTGSPYPTWGNTTIPTTTTTRPPVVQETVEITSLDCVLVSTEHRPPGAGDSETRWTWSLTASGTFSGDVATYVSVGLSATQYMTRSGGAFHSGWGDGSADASTGYQTSYKATRDEGEPATTTWNIDGLQFSDWSYDTYLDEYEAEFILSSQMGQDYVRDEVLCPLS